MANRTVLFIVASEGFQPVEYHEPKKLLEKAGFLVSTGSNKLVPAIAQDGSTVPVDILLDNVNPADYDGIFFIGGGGAMDNLDNESSYRIARQAGQIDMPLGAICVVTRILAKAGVLKNKQATGWNGDNQLQSIYKNYGVTLSDQPLVIDGNIITAAGPLVAKEFGQAIVALLQDSKGWGQ